MKAIKQCAKLQNKLIKTKHKEQGDEFDLSGLMLNIKFVIEEVDLTDVEEKILNESESS